METRALWRDTNSVANSDSAANNDEQKHTGLATNAANEDKEKSEHAGLIANFERFER